MNHMNTMLLAAAYATILSLPLCSSGEDDTPVPELIPWSNVPEEWNGVKSLKI